MQRYNEQPWWVSSIYKMGVPTAVAIYLIWFLTNKIQSNLEAVQQSLSSHIQIQQQQINNSERQLNLLRVICAEGARSVTERNACFNQ